MAALPSPISTGYEAHTSAKLNADAGRAVAAENFYIASDEEMIASNAYTDKMFAPAGAASSYNERSDGTMVRPIAGKVSKVSRTRSRNSRATSKSTSSAEEMQVATDDAMPSRRSNVACPEGQYTSN